MPLLSAHLSALSSVVRKRRTSGQSGKPTNHLVQKSESKRGIQTKTLNKKIGKCALPTERQSRNFAHSRRGSGAHFLFNPVGNGTFPTNNGTGCFSRHYNMRKLSKFLGWAILIATLVVCICAWLDL